MKLREAVPVPPPPSVVKPPPTTIFPSVWIANAMMCAIVRAWIEAIEGGLGV